MRAHHRTALATVTAAAVTGGLLGLTAGGVNTSTRAQAFAQNSAGVPGGDVKLDAVAGDGRADLLVGSDEDGGDGALTYLTSDGTKITTKGARLIGVKDVGVSATGTPWFGSIIAN
ncbi:hypothetical protein [Streptomyces griseoluteus]|uniref:hypothetical protein n=1 Tax=Streptomyces griseoluteus TaxID=29306 RepID=UPI0036938F0D